MLVIHDLSVLIDLKMDDSSSIFARRPALAQTSAQPFAYTLGRKKCAS